MPKIENYMPKTGFCSPKTPIKMPKIMFLANIKNFWRFTIRVKKNIKNKVEMMWEIK